MNRFGAASLQTDLKVVAWSMAYFSHYKHFTVRYKMSDGSKQEACFYASDAWEARILAMEFYDHIKRWPNSIDLIHEVGCRFWGWAPERPIKSRIGKECGQRHHLAPNFSYDLDSLSSLPWLSAAFGVSNHGSPRDDFPAWTQKCRSVWTIRQIVGRYFWILRPGAFLKYGNNLKK